MMSRISLRRAVPADAAAIGRVFDAAVQAGWTYLGELAQVPMFPAQEWDEVVASHAPPNVLIVAEDQTDRVAGFTAVHPHDGGMFLLFVDPAFAGHGIGRTLLAAAHDALRAAGCPEAYLHTHEQNDQALAVYAAAGYRTTGSVRESDRGVAIRELRLVGQL